MFRNVVDDSSQLGLVQITVWCIGEYGDSLIRTCLPVDEDTNSYPAASETEVINALDKCLRLHNADVMTKSLIISSLLKLSVRFSPSCNATITELISSFKNSMSLELQQRSSEFSLLLTSRWNGIRGDLLGKMPVLDEAAVRRRRDGEGVGEPGAAPINVNNAPSNVAPRAAPAGSSFPVSSGPTGNAAPNLLDLDFVFGGGAPSPTVSAPAVFGSVLPGVAPTPTAAATSTDLLSDIFSLSTTLAPTPPAGTLPMTTMGAAVAPALLSTNPTIVAYDKAGLQINMDLSKPNPTNAANTRIICKFSNQTSVPLTDLNFQVQCWLLFFFLYYYFYRRRPYYYHLNYIHSRRCRRYR